MGRDSIAKPFHETRLAAYERARQQRLGGDAHDWRGGVAYRLERSQGHSRLCDRTGFRHCHLQGPKADPAPLEPAIAPAYSARRWPDDRFGLAAGRFSASNIGTRYARLRRTGNEMQIAISLRERSRVNPLASSVFALNALAFVMASPAIAFTAYVSNETRNCVTIIDTGKMEVAKTVQVGHRPRGIALSQDGGELFICAGDDDLIQILDTKKLSITRTLPSETRTTVAEMPLAAEPEGMELSPDGKVLVNTSETTNMAHLIDTQTRKIFANVLVDARPRAAQYTPDGSELWASSEVGGTVSVIDATNPKVKQKIAFAVPGLSKEAIQPVGMRFTPDGKKAFVALGPANRVAVIDTATKKVEKYLLFGQRVWQLALTRDGKYLYTSNGVSNDVSTVDVASLKVLRSIPVGSFPWGVAIARQ